MQQVITNQRDTAANKRSYKGRLLQCAAASAAAWVMANSPAHAAIPAECDVQVGPNIIDCVVPAPDELEQVDVMQDNTTILIGDADTPTTLNTLAGDGVALNGDGALTIIINAGSTVNAANGAGIRLSGDGLFSIITAENSAIAGRFGINATANGVNGALNLNLAGDVSGQLTGVVLANQGIAGDLVLNVNSGAQIRGFERDGIEAINIAGDMMIDTSDATVRGGMNGINAGASTGAITINTGDVTGDTEDGIFLITGVNVDNISVNTTAGTVSGGQNGIFLDQDGSGIVSVETANVTGENANGIEVRGEGSSIVVNSALGSVSGGMSGILVSNTGSGLTSIRTANVTGVDGAGIIAFSSGTSLIIDTTLADLVSGGITGISANNDGNSRLVVTTGGRTVGNQDTGIGVFNAGTDTIVDSSAGSVLGQNQGVQILSNGSGNISLTAADVTGLTSNAVRIFTGQDVTDVTVDTAAGTVQGGENGFLVEHFGTGALSITTADVTGETGSGIFAENGPSGTDVMIDSSAGTVTGNSVGIMASNNGTGALAVTAADVAGTNAIGILAANSANGMDLSVDSSLGSVSGAATGIVAMNEGSGRLSVTTGNVTSQDASAIAATNGLAGTDTVIDTSAGDVSGTSGVFAIHGGSGELSVTTANVTGTTNVGISLLNGGTDLTIDSSAGSVVGEVAGIASNNVGTGALSITTGSVIGTDGFGIVATNSGTGLVIDSRAGSVTGATNGINAINDGSSSLSIVTADVIGNDSIGNNVENNGLEAFIDTTAGTVTGSNEAIIASNNGGSLTVLTGDLNGLASAGLLADNNAGTTFLTVDTSAGSITSNFFGIVATNEGTGDLSVTSGNISVAVNDAVRVTNSAAGGNVVVDTSAGSVVAEDEAIFARQESAGTLSITTADVSTGDNAVLLETAGGNATVTNQGTIMAGNFAIASTNASLGNVTVNNEGTILGRVSFGVGNEVVNNNGVFSAMGDSFFGDGEDVFFNNGRLQVESNAVFNGLELINNSGVVTLANGNVGDSLRVDGEYLGSGGTLDLDVNFAAPPAADQLIVDGRATGNTTLAVNGLTPLQQFGSSVVVVDAGAGSDADAFALAGGDVQQLGFLTVALSFDAANNDFLLGSAIGTGVFQATKFGEGAQSLWYRSADAWAAHVDARRHSDKDVHSPLWLQFYGATSDRDESFDFSSGGFTQNIVLDYSQDYFGLQGGVEFGPGNASEGVFYGLTTGYVSSNLGFDGSADNVRYDAYNVGAYAGYVSDGFFANALAKYDFINADIRNSSVGYSAAISADAYGARVEGGYRWTSQSGFFVEPSASLEYQKTSLDDFDVLGASFDFDSFDGLRGQAGVRIGGESEINGGNMLTYYLGAKAVHEFEGDGSVTFSLPASSATVTNNPIDTYGRIDLGLNIATKGGVTGFIEGNADISGGYTSFGGRVGIRIAF